MICDIGLINKTDVTGLFFVGILCVSGIFVVCTAVHLYESFSWPFI